MQHCSKKHILIKNQFIKKIAASVLLLVFAFSITPAIVFHNWLADHTDTVKKIITTNEEQVGKKTFNCHCDHIVAESPFTEPVILIFAPAKKIYASRGIIKQLHFTSSQKIIHTLRGPPAV